MDEKTFLAFHQLREDFKNYCTTLLERAPFLFSLQKELIAQRGESSYPIETPVVYNHEWDDIGPHDDIRLILIADNPGRREQEAKNRRYLIGPSGKILERFFQQYPELGIQNRRQILILNKTPIHTPRTTDLKFLNREPAVASLLIEGLRKMAEFAYRAQTIFPAIPLWIIGYSEMSKGKLFWPYTEHLLRFYEQDPLSYSRLFLFRHFSMNQFIIDLARHRTNNEPVPETLRRLGEMYRKRVFRL
ncbi:MAG TPA: hypothetical protein PLW34_11855 [Termitinemataceae bacterium]|nr:hypothetical protein [Termitinemataceae bacterium]HOM24290.1 hypothetical protein [Termitinemataceae bacterium]HPQ01411.1 hypothetical protein [Termitinemataceae bacterium]